MQSEGSSGESGSTNSSYIPQQFGRFSETSVIHTVSQRRDQSGMKEKVVESKNARLSGGKEDGKKEEASGFSTSRPQTTEYCPNQFGMVNFSSPTIQSVSKSVTSGRSKCRVTDSEETSTESEKDKKK